nr:MAG TPA: hypothetical protein [Caudoviricetes sp.]
MPSPSSQHKIHSRTFVLYRRRNRRAIYKNAGRPLPASNPSSRNVNIFPRYFRQTYATDKPHELSVHAVFFFCLKTKWLVLCKYIKKMGRLYIEIIGYTFYTLPIKRKKYN